MDIDEDILDSYLALDEFNDIIIEGYKDIKKPGSKEIGCTIHPIKYKFAQVNYFYEVTKRLPKSDSVSFKEKSLAVFLKTVKNEKTLVEELLPFDKYGILKSSTEVEVTDNENLDTFLKEIFGINEEEDYLNMLRARPTHNNPDRIAKMTVCEDFDKFESLFVEIKKCLNINSYTIAKYKNGIKLDQGSYIYYKGHVGYIASAGKKFKEKGKPINKRLRIIYDNGLEIDMLHLSLKRSLDLYGDVGVIVPTVGNTNHGNTVGPKFNGYIYVLMTGNMDPVLDAYREELYKIGYTRSDIHTRLANAEKSTTYLEAPVYLVGKIKCEGNIDPHKLEKKLHSVLSICKLKVSLISSYGQIYKPREWFHVPLETIKEVIKCIGDNTIDDYYVDPINKKLIKK